MPYRRGSLRTPLPAKTGGAEGIRTPDPHNAIVVLYQLSYDPIRAAPEFRMSDALVKTFRCCNSKTGCEM